MTTGGTELFTTDISRENDYDHTVTNGQDTFFITFEALNSDGGTTSNRSVDYVDITGGTMVYNSEGYTITPTVGVGGTVVVSANLTDGS